MLERKRVGVMHLKIACEVEWHGFLLLRESAGSASSQLLRQAGRLRLQQLSLGHKSELYTVIKIAPTLMQVFLSSCMAEHFRHLQQKG